MYRSSSQGQYQVVLMIMCFDFNKVVWFFSNYFSWLSRKSGSGIGVRLWSVYPFEHGANTACLPAWSLGPAVCQWCWWFWSASIKDTVAWAFNERPVFHTLWRFICKYTPNSICIISYFFQTRFWVFTNDMLDLVLPATFNNYPRHVPHMRWFEPNQRTQVFKIM